MTKIDKDETIRDVAEALFAKKSRLGDVLPRNPRPARRDPPSLSDPRSAGCLRGNGHLPGSPADAPQAPRAETAAEGHGGPAAQDAAPGPKPEPTRVVTVRIPRSLHDALRVEAHEHRTSMNKLCISKLLQFIDTGMVPAESAGAMEQEAATMASGSGVDL